MTRRDYVKLSEAMQRMVFHASDNKELGVLRDTADEIARVLKDDNSGFDYNKFMSGCGFDV